MNKGQPYRKGVVSVVLTAFISMTAIAMATAQADERVVNVYNWSDYIDDSVLASFQKDTGIKVNYDVFDSNEMLETKLLAGSSGYDVVVPSAHFLSRQIRAGVFEKLDKDKLSNLGNMWDVISERTAIYDPGNDYSVNYMWGTTGIGYVAEKVREVLGEDAPLDSWALVFDPQYADKLASCGIYWLDAPVEILAAIQAYLGEKPGDWSNIDKAVEVADKVRKDVSKFNSSEYISALANGDICVAVGWSGDVFQAQSRAEEAKNGLSINYYIPREGALMWFDQMAIPADAKNKAEAYEFINYLMKPEMVAKVSDFVAYANGNKTSQEFMDKVVLENPAIYPDEEVMGKLFTVLAPEGKDQRTLNRAWTRIKSGN
ncbi:MAG: polyamine ABC transporter substrate-binding protein [Thiothrix sp.]|nr:polyamine ABC transporter substrate-binding protein [Thiothrix sp.]HPE62129.1 polyamine ABC transporter substrate-binding protein [Thiolinea sp.]